MSVPFCYWGKGMAQDLKATIRRVRDSKPQLFRTIHSKGMRTQTDGTEALVDVLITPMATPPSGREIYMMARKR